MNFAYAQSVFGFDLDLLHEPSNNDVDCEILQNRIQQKAISSGNHDLKKGNAGRSRKSDISYFKKKLVDTDTVVAQYNLRCQQVAELEKILLETNDKCREACIERDTVRQNCDCLEKECGSLRSQIRELERKILDHEHINAATESHTHQLQQLVKESDTQIEGFKVEILLAKATIKDLEKRVLGLTKYKEETTTHLCIIADIVASKRPITHAEKALLSKYLKLKKKRDAAKETEKNNSVKQNGDSDADVCEDFLSDTEDRADVNNEQMLSSPLLPSKIQTIQKSEPNRDDGDIDPDLTSEIISVDTGRGSSLAFSDSDTLYSPEYYVNSPLSVFSVKDHKHKTTRTDVATSPIIWSKQLQEKSTSPITVAVDTSQKAREKNTECILKTADKALSPIILPVVTNIEGIEPLPTDSEPTNSVNSRHSDSDNISDSDVEMILNNMKIPMYVTPIPLTPAKSQVAKSSPSHLNLNDKIIATSIKDLHDTMRVLAKDRPDITVPDLDNAIVYFSGFESDASYQKSSLDINSHESDVLYQNTYSVINSLEPDDLFEVASIDDEHECVNSNQQSTEAKTSPRIQIENERGTQKCVHSIAPRTSGAKTNIKDNIQFEIDTDNLQSETVTNQDKNYNSTLQEVVSSPKSANKDLKKTSKAKKLTRIEKLRKNLIPKSKIRRDITPPRILRSKRNTLSSIQNKKANNNESSASLNNLDVYKKAVRVMAELKSQQKKVTPKITTKGPQISIEDISRHKDDTLKLMDEETTERQEAVTTLLANVNEHIPEKHNNSVSVTNETNATDVSGDTVDTKIRNNTPRSIGKTPQRKSVSDEIDNIILQKCRKKYPSISLDKDIVIVLTRAEREEKIKSVENNTVKTVDVDIPEITTKVVVCNDKLETECNKRILRSATRRSLDIEKNNNERKIGDKNIEKRALTSKPRSKSTLNNPDSSGSLTLKPSSELPPSDKLVSYNDLDIFNDEPSPPKKQRCLEFATNSILNPQESVLCKMIEIYGVNTTMSFSKKVPEATVNAINTKLTDSINHIIQLPVMETQNTMKKIIKDMQKWTFKEFLAGLIAYLMDPTRKLELFNKVNAPPAPPMTKVEQVLLYIVTRLSWDNIDTVDCVLTQIEYTLFRLNKTPDIRVVESMAHFYAILCRYIKAKSRLRLFVLDAMYCMTYSAIALIRQCIEVWMHILPLAHMGTAKSPLVRCLVYLMQYYKCDDTQNKVKDMRAILKHKYSFQLTDWPEKYILDIFKNAILELKDDAIENKMLKLALILLAKRNGPKWCQDKIIQCMLMPMITQEIVPERVKVFCVSILGALFKPYPENMKVHCEIAVNQLMDILDKNPSPVLEEAIYTSLILLSKHNQNRVIQALLLWRPKRVSPNMKNVLKDFVREKPVKVWKSILGRVSLVK